ncbi:MAG: response regulator transcription factor [Armatimonas sp.]
MLGERTGCLIAEDDGVTMKFISRTLERAGYEIVGVVSDGEKAIGAVLELEPDFLVIDLEMPRMSGIEACRQITAIRPMPILMISGHQDMETIEQAIAAGVTTFLTKPFLIAELLEAVQGTLERFQKPIMES